MLKRKPIGKAIIIVCIVLIAWIALFEVKSRKIIKQDVEEKITFMNQGNLNWTIFSGIDIAPELLAIVSASNDDNEPLSGMFVENNKITYKVGFVFPWGCDVTFNFDGYDFKSFIQYCSENSITDYAVMKDAFYVYKDGSTRNYTSNICMKYRKIQGRWSCNYRDEAFLEMASCGMLSQYADYYNQSISNIQKFIEETSYEKSSID